MRAEILSEHSEAPAVSAGDIVAAIREQIAAGELRPGDMAPTERAVAERFGAPRRAVRHAFEQLEAAGFLERKPNCRPVIRVPPRVQASPRLDSRVIATSLMRTPDDRGPLQMFHGIQIAAKSYRIDLSNLAARDWEEKADAEEEFLLELARERRPAGIIIWVLDERRSRAALEEVRHAGIPLVFVGRLPEGLDGDCVVTNNETSMAEATRHLIELGHRRIGYLTNPEQAPAVWDRLAGHRAALAEARISYRPERVYEVPWRSPTEAAPLFDEVLAYFQSLSEPVTAFCAVNDHVAIEMYRAIQRAGARIPEDYSIVGFDGILEWLPDGGYLTTLSQNFERIGILAARLLMERIETGKQEPYRHILVEAPLHLHGSTARPRGAA